MVTEQFYALYSGISLIIGRREGDNERPCAFEPEKVWKYFRILQE